MCGIICFIGGKKYCFDSLLGGLIQLQNRGYDSAGIVVIKDNKFLIKKYASTEKETALKRLEEDKEFFGEASIGLAHTRWATHGPKNDINSHPHISYDGKFAIVHNGIIENHEIIKERLIEKNIKFISGTDTEVISNLIAYNYNQQNEDDKDINNAITESLSDLKGTWGLGILCLDSPDILYSCRHGSSLVIGTNDNMGLITSEQSGFTKQVNNYIALRNNDIANISYIDNKIKLNTHNEYKKMDIDSSHTELAPTPFVHWTLKEIHEQIDSSFRAISMGARVRSNGEVKLGGLNKSLEMLKNINNIILLGCGTSYHAALYATPFFKELNDFYSVTIYDGAEFSVDDIPKYGNNAAILISQSGETKDLHRCVNLCNSNNIITIGVINVVDSLIAREVDCGCYLNAGREVGVASTKAFTSEAILLVMIAVWFSQLKNTNFVKRKKIVEDLRNISYNIENILKTIDVMKYLEYFDKYNSCFILGKSKGEAIAKEGSLKIKEISYLHAEAYSSSSLKHGPFALLDKEFPVILLCPNNELLPKNMNAYEEMKARGAKIIVITDKEDLKVDHKLIIPKNKTFSELLMIIPMQLIAYELSVRKGNNPDMPRNLAKVCTTL